MEDSEDLVTDNVIVKLNDVVMDKINGEVTNKLNDLNGTIEREHRTTSDSAINRQGHRHRHRFNVQPRQVVYKLFR
ncbi:hypothetical protein ACHWQZ_G004687 [Mnemiopsis leidyi]